LRSSGSKSGGLLAVLTIGGCLLAPGLSGAAPAAADNTTKPAPRKSAAPTHRNTARSAAPKPTTHKATATAARKTAPHSTTSHTVARTTPVHSGSAKTTTQKVGTHKGQSARRRALTGSQRLARLHLEPDRVREIQQALGREGYLQGEPSGQWDDHTRAAMLRYQTDHGFPATGLPEAKSLMKLGLGSHPLPASLDPGIARSNAPDTPQGVSSTGRPSPVTPEATPQPQ
jgi:hypothetical protein